MEHTPEQEAGGEVAAVRAAMAAGRLSVADPEKGFQRAMYAVCPRDGGHAQVRRIERGARGAITRVTMRCPQCATEFSAAPEDLHLR